MAHSLIESGRPGAKSGKYEDADFVKRGGPGAEAYFFVRRSARPAARRERCASDAAAIAHISFQSILIFTDFFMPSLKDVRKASLIIAP